MPSLDVHGSVNRSSACRLDEESRILWIDTSAICWSLDVSHSQNSFVSRQPHVSSLSSLQSQNAHGQGVILWSTGCLPRQPNQPTVVLNRLHHAQRFFHLSCSYPDHIRSRHAGCPLSPLTLVCDILECHHFPLGHAHLQEDCIAGGSRPSAYMWLARDR